MCLDIDTILDMLSWENDLETQQKGICEASEIRYLSVLIQPIESKTVWENCAKVISSKSDNELEKYLVQLLMWLQDMNWPGAETISERLLSVPQSMLAMPFNYCLHLAEITCDYAWERALRCFGKRYGLL